VIGLYFFAFAGTGSFGGLFAGWLVHVGGTGLAFLVAGLATIAGTLAVGHFLRVPAARIQPEEGIEPERAAA
jgi:hypothetical protein